jgi:transcription elongation factor GreA
MIKTLLTPEGLKRFQEELDYLKNVARVEIAEQLRETIGDDNLDENAEYEALRNEQAFIEGRISELRNLLAAAKIIDKGVNSSNVVEIGSTVTFQEADFEPETYTIVGPAEANPADGKISFESPLGQSLLGHKVNDNVEIYSPEGNFNVAIQKIE